MSTASALPVLDLDSARAATKLGMAASEMGYISQLSFWGKSPPRTWNQPCRFCCCSRSHTCDCILLQVVGGSGPEGQQERLEAPVHSCLMYADVKGVTMSHCLLGVGYLQQQESAHVALSEE